MLIGKREGLTERNTGVDSSFGVYPSQLRQTPGITGRNMSGAHQGLTVVELVDRWAREHEGADYMRYCSCVHCHMVYVQAVTLAGDTVHSKTVTGAAQALWALQRKGAGGC